MFTIAVDRFRKLIEVKLSGFIEIAEVDALRTALMDEIRANKLLVGDFVQLLDITDFPIQSQDVHASMRSFGADSEMMPRKLAICAGASTGRMQARRTNVECPSVIFDTREQALEWLFGDHLVELAAELGGNWDTRVSPAAGPASLDKRQVA